MRFSKLERYDFGYDEILKKLGIQGQIYDLQPTEEGVMIIVIVKKK